MSNTQLRRAVAESLGWLFVPSRDIDGKAVPEFWLHEDSPEKSHYEDFPFPNYPTSLDACRDGWEKDAPREYWYLLFELVNGLNPGQLKLTMTLDKCWIAVCNATAEQRCRAFLKWKGKVI